jgi:hypothetical protein
MNLTMLVKKLDSGQVEASVLEFPGYRFEAASREMAIEQLRTALTKQLQNTEFLPLEIPIKTSIAAIDQPWNQLFGLFKDDPYFDEVMEIIQAERNALGDDELDPAYYL